MTVKIIAAATALGIATLAGVGAVAQTALAPAEMTRAQFLAKAGDRFTAMDANRDGRVTRDERRAHRMERRADRPGKRMRGRRGGGPDVRMERMDLNDDGRVSRAEAVQQATAMFDRRDANRDGFLDTSEMQRRGARAAPGNAN